MSFFHWLSCFFSSFLLFSSTQSCLMMTLCLAVVISLFFDQHKLILMSWLGFIFKTVPGESIYHFLDFQNRRYGN